MKINNGWSVAVVASATLVLAACSGNPVDENNGVPKAVATATKAAKKVVAAEDKKIEKLASVAKTKPVPRKIPRKVLSRSAVNAKKQAIAALGKKTVAKKSIKIVKNQTPIVKRVSKKTNKKPVQLAKAIVPAPKKVPLTQARAVTPPVARTSAATQSNQVYASKRAQILLAKRQQEAQRAAAQRQRQQAIAQRNAAAKKANVQIRRASFNKPAKKPSIRRIDPNVSFGYALSNAAVERTKHRVRYDGKYLKIGYPWGDVPKSIGVCTDVVIRAYRKLGIDLQQEVHKDISSDFYAYPNLVKWGLNKPDTNIDHRRVYNLQAFFRRHKAELPMSRNPRNYKPGDLVTWMVGPNFPHIGIVVNKPSKADPNRLMISHNIGNGPQIEDILFSFPMTGHYRYTPQHRRINPSLLYAKTPPPASVINRQRNKGLTYAELLEASRLLTGSTPTRAASVSKDLLTKNTKQSEPKDKIMLAHLDQAAIEALLK